MTDFDILCLAKDCGFDACALLPAEKIEFDFSFRAFCEDNRCGKWGKSHSCPPLCPSPEKMREKALAYTRALVLCTLAKVENPSDTFSTKSAQKRHNDLTLRLLEKLQDGGISALPIGSGECTLCPTCAAEKGEKCRHPQKRLSSTSAYCINVEKLAKACALPYRCENSALPLFGLIMMK